jgi:hypothetical protein
MIADYLGDYDIRVTTLASGREIDDVTAPSGSSGARAMFSPQAWKRFVDL